MIKKVPVIDMPSKCNCVFLVSYVFVPEDWFQDFKEQGSKFFVTKNNFLEKKQI